MATSVRLQRYLAAADGGAAHQFMEDTGLGSRTRARNVLGLLSDMLGNSRHLWMWDQVSMAKELERAGFVEIRKCDAFDSEDPRFSEVEDPGRFVDAIALQCRRR